jgi:hypothetical protein
MHRIGCEFFEDCDPVLGVKPHTLVSYVSFLFGQLFGTFVECTLYII